MFLLQVMQENELAGNQRHFPLFAAYMKKESIVKLHLIDLQESKLGNGAIDLEIGFQRSESEVAASKTQNFFGLSQMLENSIGIRRPSSVVRRPSSVVRRPLSGVRVRC